MNIEQYMELESLIDKYSVSEILAAIASICAEKADHIQSNYDDKSLAKEWRKDAKIVATCSERVM